MLHIDSSAHEDFLDRYDFAKEIAHYLTEFYEDGSDSIVFGLTGKWGSGKSSLLNFIIEQIKLKEKLRQDKRIAKVFNFNPWMFSGQEQLQSIFLNELAKELGDFDVKVKSKIKPVIKILSLLSSVKYVHSGAGEGVKALEGILQNLSKEKPLSKLKSELNKLIVQNNVRLYITIDDIDRLTPTEIAQIFQLIKLNANFKNTVYIAAFDKDVVKKALEKEYNDNAERYLEKIIQIDYAVPEILGEVIENIFFKNLTDLFQRIGIEYEIQQLYDIWFYHSFKDYFKTLRDVYRYINGVQFRLPSIYKEVNISNFLLLEAIRIFDYSAYTFIYTRFIENKSNTKLRNTLTESDIEEVKNSISKSVIKYLFTRRNPIADYNYSTERELSDPKYFEIYFALKISGKDISEEELANFIKDKSNRFKILEVIYENSRTQSFLRKLANPKLKLHYDLKNIELSFATLLSFYGQKEADFNVIAFLLWNVLENLVNNNEKPEHAIHELITELTTNTGNLNFAKFYYLGSLIDGFEDNFKHGFRESRSQLLKNKDKLLSSFMSMLKDWPHYFLSDISKRKSYFLLKYFITKFAQHSPDKYDLYFNDFLKNEETTIALLEMLLILDSSLSRSAPAEWKYPKASGRDNQAFNSQKPSKAIRDLHCCNASFLHS